MDKNWAEIGRAKEEYEENIKSKHPASFYQFLYVLQTRQLPQWWKISLQFVAEFTPNFLLTGQWDKRGPMKHLTDEGFLPEVIKAIWRALEKEELYKKGKLS